MSPWANPCDAALGPKATNRCGCTGGAKKTCGAQQIGMIHTVLWTIMTVAAKAAFCDILRESVVVVSARRASRN